MLQAHSSKITARAQDFWARADELAPVLNSRASLAETLRRCPDEAIADLEASELLRACQPFAYGGYEMGYDVLCGIIQRLIWCWPIIR
jgi:alkylation response protein AidB-like acyl-CoA dehydrogenase